MYNATLKRYMAFNNGRFGEKGFHIMMEPYSNSVLSYEEIIYIGKLNGIKSSKISPQISNFCQKNLLFKQAGPTSNGRTYLVSPCLADHSLTQNTKCSFNASTGRWVSSKKVHQFKW